MAVLFYVFANLVGAALAATPSPGFNVMGMNTGAPFQPFGSNRPCSALVNETMNQSGDQLILERLLITSDSMLNSFSSSSSSSMGGSNPQLDTWANQACGQMQNLVGYLKSACQFTDASMNPTEMVAQLKVRALGALKDYLCNNNNVNLKELAMNNGAQCARRTDLTDFRCPNNQPTSSSSSFLPSPPRVQIKYGTAIILSSPSYNADNCKSIADLTNCIQDNYARGTDFCSSRASNHYARIFSSMLQAVMCTSGGFSTFNQGNFLSPNNPQMGMGTFNNGMNNNNNGMNGGSFPQQGNNNNGMNSGSFPQQGNNGFPQQGNNNGFPQQGGSFGMNNMNNGFPNNGNNFPNNNNNNNNFPSGSSNFPSGSSNFPSGSSNFPQSSGSFSSNTGSFAQNPNNNNMGPGTAIPPYNPSRRPYNGGSTIQAGLATMTTLLITICLV